MPFPAGSHGRQEGPPPRFLQQRALSKRERKRLREAEERRRELESLKPFAFDPKRDTTLGVYFEVWGCPLLSTSSVTPRWACILRWGANVGNVTAEIGQ